MRVPTELVPARDLSGDGRPDIVEINPDLDAIIVRSLTGELLWRKSGIFPSDTRVAPFDRDVPLELFVPSCGCVLDGKDGSLLWQVPGNNMHVAADLDGDRIDDVVAYDQNGLGQTVFSVYSVGRRKAVWRVPLGSMSLSTYISDVADYTGDGRRDVLLSMGSPAATIVFNVARKSWRSSAFFAGDATTSFPSKMDANGRRGHDAALVGWRDGGRRAVFGLRDGATLGLAWRRVFATPNRLYVGGRVTAVWTGTRAGHFIAATMSGERPDGSQVVTTYVVGPRGVAWHLP